MNLVVGEEHDDDEGILEAKTPAPATATKTTKVLDWDDIGLGSSTIKMG